MPKPRISIIDVQGVKKYLNLTADDHNGHDGNEFVKLVKVKSDIDISLLYDVTSMTVGNWRKKLEKENERKISKE